MSLATPPGRTTLWDAKRSGRGCSVSLGLPLLATSRGRRDACRGSPGGRKYHAESWGRSFRQPHRVRSKPWPTTEAEAKFRKSLKATWKGKKVTAPYEVEARVARNKTARLKELRLAKEAADKKAES